MVISSGCTGSAIGDDQTPGGSLAPEIDGPSSGGGSLRIGLSVDPLTIDPRFIADDEGAIVVGAMFEPLVRLDADGEVVPGAAASWRISEDGRALTFRLRDATFHDGRPVTATDFKRTFDRIADGSAEPPSFLSYLVEPIQGSVDAQRQGGGLLGVEVVDDRTLTIHLTGPRPGYLSTLADPSLVPVPQEADTDPEGFALQPVGNGPFALAEPREPGGFLRLTAVDGHPRRPMIDEVVFQVYADDPSGQRQWQDLLDGQLQVATVPPDRYDDAVERFGTSIDGYQGPGVLDGITSSVYLYGFDVTDAPFDDARVRRAVSLAIDREALADDVMQETRVPATAIAPPPVPGSQRVACRHCRHDPAAARALIEEVFEERRADAIAAAEAEAARAAAEAEAEGEDATEGDAAEAGDDATAGDAPDGGGEGEGQTGEPDAQESVDDTSDTTEDAAGDDVDDTAEGTEQEAAAPAEPIEVEVEPVLTSMNLSHSRSRTHAAIAERMAADISSALDIEVTIEARNLAVLMSEVRAGEVGFFRFGWQSADPSLAAYLEPLFHSREIGEENLTGYGSDEVDGLLDIGTSSLDATTSLRSLRTAERRILDDAPVLPLLWYRHSMVVADEVDGLVHTAFGRMDLAQVSLDLG